MGEGSERVSQELFLFLISGIHGRWGLVNVMIAGSIEDDVILIVRVHVFILVSEARLRRVRDTEAIRAPAELPSSHFEDA